MKITLLTVGRLGRAPEALLAKDYVERATASGRSVTGGSLSSTALLVMLPVPINAANPD